MSGQNACAQAKDAVGIDTCKRDDAEGLSAVCEKATLLALQLASTDERRKSKASKLPVDKTESLSLQRTCSRSSERTRSWRKHCRKHLIKEFLNRHNNALIKCGGALCTLL